MSLITNNGQNLPFPEFKDIPVSTKTFVASTNLRINIYELYKKLPITPYTVIPKKRGRKKKEAEVDPNKDIPHGSIISVGCNGEVRGVVLKKKKNEAANPKYFRNAISVFIVLDKMINFKICKNGTFHFTGCKERIHTEQCVSIIWNFINDYPELYKFKKGTEFSVMYVPCMRNIDFSLGFLVDREKLRNYISQEQGEECIIEETFSYTGVVIKFPLRENILELPIVKHSVWNSRRKKWSSRAATYQEYVDTLPPKDAKNKINKKRFHSFLVFHSGKVIMSGLTANIKKPVYDKFLRIIRQAYDHIEERLDPIVVESIVPRNIKPVDLDLSKYLDMDDDDNDTRCVE